MTFLDHEHPRMTDGRFAEKPQSGAEVSLASAASIFTPHEIDTAAQEAAYALIWANDLPGDVEPDAEMVDSLREDIDDFVSAYPELLAEARAHGYSGEPAQFGHDFAMTVAGTGVGFRDREGLVGTECAEALERAVSARPEPDVFAVEGVASLDDSYARAMRDEAASIYADGMNAALKGGLTRREAKLAVADAMKYQRMFRYLPYRLHKDIGTDEA